MPECVYRFVTSSTSRTNLDVVGFLSDVRNDILFVQPTATTGFFQNASRTRRAGVETSGSLGSPADQNECCCVARTGHLELFVTREKTVGAEPRCHDEVTARGATGEQVAPNDGRRIFEATVRRPCVVCHDTMPLAGGMTEVSRSLGRSPWCDLRAPVPMGELGLATLSPTGLSLVMLVYVLRLKRRQIISEFRGSQVQ